MAIADAVAAYSGFHEAKPHLGKAKVAPYPKMLVKLGRAVSVAYEPEPPSKRAGHVYEHQFGDTGYSMEQERPVLAVDPTTGELYFLRERSRYHFSDRGIIG